MTTQNTATTTLEHVNAMPAPTWGWLRMNETKLELADELAAAPQTAVEVEDPSGFSYGAANAFDTAIAAVGER